MESCNAHLEINDVLEFLHNPVLDDLLALHERVADPCDGVEGNQPLAEDEVERVREHVDGAYKVARVQQRANLGGCRFDALDVVDDLDHLRRYRNREPTGLT